jgi:hypothetical protein
VLGGKGVAIVLLGEDAGNWIEEHLQRGHVGLNKDIGCNHFCREVDAFTVFSWSAVSVGACGLGPVPLAQGSGRRGSR